MYRSQEIKKVNNFCIGLLSATKGPVKLIKQDKNGGLIFTF